MARPIALIADKVSSVRYVASAANDSTTLSDSAFPLAADATNGGTINCQGYATIWVSAEFVGGTNPTVDLDMLVYDDGAANDEHWGRLYVGSSPAVYKPTLAKGRWFEVRVDGGRFFPRIENLVGSPTSVRILARPGTPLPRLAGSRA